MLVHAGPNVTSVQRSWYGTVGNQRETCLSVDVVHQVVHCKDLVSEQDGKQCRKIRGEIVYKVVLLDLQIAHIGCKSDLCIFHLSTKVYILFVHTSIRTNRPCVRFARFACSYPATYRQHITGRHLQNFCRICNRIPGQRFWICVDASDVLVSDGFEHIGYEHDNHQMMPGTQSHRGCI